jgi:hypothetical protein
MIRADIIGDAKVLSNLLLDLRDAADESLRDSMKYLGHTIQKDTRMAIVKNPFGWTPLTKEWLKYKKRNGYHRKTYMMTKSLYISLGQEVNKVGGNYQLKVGFPKTLHPVSKRPLSKIAEELEEGRSNRKLPARPLLSKTVVTGQQKFLQSKYTPDKLFKIKMERLVGRASSRVTTFNNLR